jgi:NTP pyrophosphatase (non-canonical NTP hydrolase)
MDLQEALAKIWEDPRYQTKSPLEALKHLNEEVTEALIAWLRSDQIRARQELTEAFPKLLVALRLLDIDPVQLIQEKAKQANRRQRIMYIVGNRVEVRVGDELRGSWTVWSEEDLKEVHRLAEEFDCQLIQAPEESINTAYGYGTNGYDRPTSSKIPR